MPTTASRIIVNAKTGQSYTETYEIPDPTPEELAAAKVKETEEIVKRLTNAVQAHMEDVARSKGYDNLMSACSYAAVANAFQAESQKFIEWRANCWMVCHHVLAEAEAGNIAVPSEQELVAMLPVFSTQ
jgi:hypothetical protein